MPDKLAELRALVAAIPELESTRIISPGYTHLANLTVKMPDGRPIAMTMREWSEGIAALRDNATAMLDVIEAAQGAQWIRHALNCEAIRTTEGDCTCGLDALSAALEKFGRQA